MSLIRLENISKHFGAITALDGVSLEISVGEAVGLMGDNGAGKPTMVKVLAGNYGPTNGNYFIDGAPARVGTGGGVDCVEAYASGTMLRALAAERGVPVATLFSEFHSGALAAALQTFVHDQALTVALAMTLTDPEIVVIGGGVTEMAGYPFEELVRQTDECLSPVLGRGIRPIVRATLGPAAASWGALHLICDALGRHQDTAPTPRLSATS